ncbi:hypothetical protein CPC08DRAFT_762285 [Agrocybe pediades]|nr:hypothetical protein CPC08DRAFT_762285 [Agrocybe pediades]
MPLPPSVPSKLNVPVIRAFVALNIIGGAGMLLVLLTAVMSRNIKRLSTWYSFCFSWIVLAVSYSLLTFAGQQLRPDPAYSLCFAQAALVYSMPPTTACTTLALLVHILLSFPDSETETPVRINLATTTLLLMGPYTVFLVIFTGVSLYVSRNPDTLQKPPKGTYCNSMDTAWLRVSAVVVAVVSVAIIVVQGQLAARLYTSYRSLGRSSRSFMTIIRIAAFTLIGFVTLVISMIFSVTRADDDDGLAFDMIISFFPLLALLVFGSQKDIYNVWFSKFHIGSGPEIRDTFFFGRKPASDP